MKTRTVAWIALLACIVVAGAYVAQSHAEGGRPDGCTPLLVVYGHVYYQDGATPYPDGMEVMAVNQSNGLVGLSEIGQQETGVFEIVFMQPPNDAVACEGDEISLHVEEGAIIEPGVVELTELQVLTGEVFIDLFVTVESATEQVSWTEIKLKYAD